LKDAPALKDHVDIHRPRHHRHACAGDCHFETARSEDLARAKAARAEDKQARDALAADIRRALRRVEAGAEAQFRAQLLWKALGAQVVVSPPPPPPPSQVAR
jgi:hypothetical protein